MMIEKAKGLCRRRVQVVNMEVHQTGLSGLVSWLQLELCSAQPLTGQISRSQ